MSISRFIKLILRIKQRDYINNFAHKIKSTSIGLMPCCLHTHGACSARAIPMLEIDILEIGL